MSLIDNTDLISTMRNLKICVIIPTYNNAGTLRCVISDLLNYTQDVIVVNDGSSDSTSSILEEFQESITVVTHDKNRGKGCALKTGFKKAIELGYRYAITIDSDGQHYAEDIPKFVRAIGENYGALIVGERDLSKVDINGKSAFANKFSNFWYSLQTGYRLNDTQTGYRAYPLQHLHGLSLLTSRYEAELELLVFAAWSGVRIISTPIQVYYPPQSERVTHFKPGLDFTRISILNTILCIGALFYGIPARISSALIHKNIFNCGFRPFTHKHGESREAAITLGRLVRSLYGILTFAVLSVGICTPIAYLYFSIGKDTENKKLRFHKLLQIFSKIFIKIFPGCKTSISDKDAASFDSPALVICNHQSHLDLPMIMSLHPKLIFLTNDWVWNNFLYGKIIHYAEFLPVSSGLESILPQLKNLKERGYSIVVFPEGTRSADCSILRFHQGAFWLANELDLDIVPLVLHGAGHYLPKKDFMLRKGEITLSVMPRVSRTSFSHLALREQASMFRKLIRSRYNKIILEKETDVYFKNLVLYKFAYRGWSIVSRSKHTLTRISKYADIINTAGRYKTVRIYNSGIGTFALMYALVNKSTEVYAYESNLADYKIASSTAKLPKNLHFVHTVWNSEFSQGSDSSDLTIVLDSENRNFALSDNRIFIPLKS